MEENFNAVHVEYNNVSSWHKGCLKCVDIFSPFLHARVRVCRIEGRFCIYFDLV